MSGFNVGSLFSCIKSLSLGPVLYVVVLYVRCTDTTSDVNKYIEIKIKLNHDTVKIISTSASVCFNSHFS